MDLVSYADRAVLLVYTGPTASGADRLTGLGELRTLLESHPSWRTRATAADITHLCAGRSALREVFDTVALYRDIPRAVALLNPMLTAYPVHPRVTDHDHSPWHLHLAETASSAAEWYLATAVFGLATAVFGLAIAATSLGFERFGVCQSTGCHAVFLDSSSNHSRRYCSDRCATRMNVAAYRIRRRDKARPGRVESIPAHPAEAGASTAADQPLPVGAATDSRR